MTRGLSDSTVLEVAGSIRACRSTAELAQLARWVRESKSTLTVSALLGLVGLMIEQAASDSALDELRTLLDDLAALLTSPQYHSLRRALVARTKAVCQPGKAQMALQLS